MFLYQEPDLIGLTALDFLTDDIDRVQIDRKEDYNRLIENIEKVSKKSKSKVSSLTKKSQSLKDSMWSVKLNKHSCAGFYYLRGEIVMEETEALVSIDVNTGSHKGDRKDGKLYLQANIEAAAEVCRQMKLRNLGGLVIIDFIDMKNKEISESLPKDEIIHGQ